MSHATPLSVSFGEPRLRHEKNFQPRAIQPYRSGVVDVASI
jgi:hypothetical protein